MKVKNFDLCFYIDFYLMIFLNTLEGDLFVTTTCYHFYLDDYIQLR